MTGTGSTSRDAASSVLAVVGISEGTVLPVAVLAVVAVAAAFLAWVVSSDERTERLSTLLRSRRGDEPR